jgi:amino acid permease
MNQDEMNKYKKNVENISIIMDNNHISYNDFLSAMPILIYTALHTINPSINERQLKKEMDNLRKAILIIHNSNIKHQKGI